jgi:GT2 family glycosyltransferase
MAHIKKIKVAVLIPNYNGAHIIGECLSALEAAKNRDVQMQILVVDNASSDGSVQYLRRNWPQIHLIELKRNLGYAGGNNVGWEMIKNSWPQISYLYLLNSDAIVEKNFLDPMVEAMENNPSYGTLQSKLLLYDDREKVNSLGNIIHFLGFGYSSYCGLKESKLIVRRKKINYASGAATLLRCEAIKQVGLFEDFMFMYLEDLDLGWRMSLAGWDNVLIPESVVYHKYDFDKGMKQYYYFERNRQYILLKNYKLLTLVCLLPAWITMEIGQLIFASINKRLGAKIKSYLFFCRPKHISHLLRQRKKIKAIRQVNDGTLLASFSAQINFQPISSVVIKYFVNPIFSLYLSAVNFIIFW